jgi:hypothetical protein
MPTLKLTQAAVDRLKPPASGRVEYWDSQLPGFGLRVSAPRPGNKDGRKIWQAFYRVDGRAVREKLGTLDGIPSVADARERARQSMTKAHARTNPVAERRQREDEERRQAEAEQARKENTVAAVIDRYLAERPVDKSRKPLRAEYLAETTRTLDKNVKQSTLGGRPLDDVVSEDIKRLVRDVAKSAPSQANHTLAYLKAMRIASPGNVPETSSVASPSVLPLPH